MGVYSRLPEKTSGLFGGGVSDGNTDRKSIRLNSSHSQISYAVFCLKKKNWSLKFPLCAPSTSTPSHKALTKSRQTFSWFIRTRSFQRWSVWSLAYVC